MRLAKKALAAGISTVGFLAAAAPVAAQYYYDDYTPYASSAAAGVVGVTWLIVCCSILLGLGIAFALAYIVYRDAKKNNVENPALWGLLTFFLGLIGLIIYFVAIKPDAVKKAQTASSSSPIEKEGKKE